MYSAVQYEHIMMQYSSTGILLEAKRKGARAWWRSKTKAATEAIQFSMQNLRLGRFPPFFYDVFCIIALLLASCLLLLALT